MDITKEEIYQIQDEIDQILLDIQNLQNWVKECKDSADSGSSEKRYLRSVSNKLMPVYADLKKVIKLEY